MRFELFIATRYLRAKRRQAFIGIITGITTGTIIGDKTDPRLARGFSFEAVKVSRRDGPQGRVSANSVLWSRQQTGDGRHVLAFSNYLFRLDSAFSGDGARAWPIAEGMVLDRVPGGAAGAGGAAIARRRDAVHFGALSAGRGYRDCEGS